MDKILAELASTCCCKDKDGKKNSFDGMWVWIVIGIIVLCSCSSGKPGFISCCNSTCGTGNQSSGSWIWLIIIFVFLFSGFKDGKLGNVNTNLINLDTDDGYDDEYYD
ncbi:hypothetical protein [Clostridium oryzae]|uniref:Uncharacterized protein n=1 Tax=Clostridium oryzae TaxID=1450648 RepID=A0A1V4I5T9_9CLOT|nr:hypothetical protein [Clostridium oryzae]OPJ55348.1 hypothetical protein CLORY_44400 [Clostridium oryzae]